MQAHNQVKGILGQILQFLELQWCAKPCVNSRSFLCLHRRCFYQAFSVFPCVWKYRCSLNVLLLLRDWVICVTLWGGTPRCKQWGLMLWGTEGSWYPAAAAGGGGWVLNLVLANSIGWSCQRYFSFLLALAAVKHASRFLDLGSWAANLGRMDSFFGREGKKNLFCTAGGWLTQVPPLVCVHISVLWGDTERHQYQSI